VFAPTAREISPARVGSIWTPAFAGEVG